MLHKLKSIATRKRKRVGRGDGSKGTYSGKGMKGQTARAGGKRRPGFEGGQTPLIRRMPKLKGFTPLNKITYQVINISALEEKFEDGAKITKVDLKKSLLIFNAKKPVKLLGTGETKKSFEVSVDAVSPSALKKIEDAKGSVILPVKKEKPVKAKYNK